jgi:hypothetical protein
MEVRFQRKFIPFKLNMQYRLETRQRCMGRVAWTQISSFSDLVYRRHNRLDGLLRNGLIKEKGMT